MERIPFTVVEENDEQFTRESEDVTAMVYAWPDIEQRLQDDPELEDLADAVRRAFRAEVISEDRPCPRP